MSQREVGRENQIGYFRHISFCFDQSDPSNIWARNISRLLSNVIPAPHKLSSQLLNFDRNVYLNVFAWTKRVKIFIEAGWPRLV